MKIKGNKIIVYSILSVIIAFALNGCSRKPVTIDTWKAWVLTRARVEDCTAMDLVTQYVDERVEVAMYNDFHKKYESWWLEGNGELPEDTWISWDIKVDMLEDEREDFFYYYYPVLAKLTLINALCSDNDQYQDKEDLTDALALYYLELRGDEFIMTAFFEYADEIMDLHNLQNLSRADLKKSMNEVIDDDGFSLFKTVLKADEKNEDRIWGADNVASLALDCKDDFFENVMALIGDFDDLKNRIDYLVSVYSCEYNSEKSSSKADVYDVVYSIEDKMYVKCSVLESNGRGEILLNSKGTHLLSL